MPVSDELLGVGERQRCDPELGLADQLGEDAAGAERDERAEGRILDDAGEQLGATADHRLDDHWQADPLDRGPDVLLGREVERDAPGLRLVRARLGRLDDDGQAELPTRPRPLPRPIGALRSSTSGMP